MRKFQLSLCLSYQHSCDSIGLYLISSIAEIEIFRLDVENELVVPVLSYPHYDGISFIIDVEHYNEPDYDICQRIIDLDGDNSSGAIDTDYQSDTLCIHTDIPIADIDLIVDNDLPLDSITLAMVAPLSDQYLRIPAGNYMLRGNGTPHVTIEQSGITTLADYVAAINTIVYKDEASYRGGNIEIQLQAWQGGLAGAIATSYLYIADKAQDIEDITLSYCQQDSSVLVDDDIPYTGYIHDMGQLLSPLTVALSGPSEVNYIFITDDYCVDTALIEVIVHASPITLGITDTTLCATDTVSIQIDTETDSQILWNDDSENNTIDIATAGAYQYTITDVNGCMVSDTFLVEYADEPTIMPVSIFVCEGESGSYFDLDLVEPGEYEYSEVSVLGCDSIIHQIEFDYYPFVPIEYSFDIAFCQGDSVLLSVVSDHIAVTYNEQLLIDNVYISNDLPITINAEDNYGCLVTDTIYPVIYENPTVNASDIINADASLGVVVDVTYGGEIIEYAWSPASHLDCSDCPYPTVLGAVDQIYYIDVITDEGCTTIDSIYVSTTESQYYLPNVVAKDANQEINQSFFLTSNTEVNYDILVYDRWGNLIAERTNLKANEPSIGWMPRMQNITSGVYVYQVLIYKGDQVEILVGDITIL